MKIPTESYEQTYHYYYVCIVGLPANVQFNLIDKKRAVAGKPRDAAVNFDTKC